MEKNCYGFKSCNGLHSCRNSGLPDNSVGLDQKGHASKKALKHPDVSGAGAEKRKNIKNPKTKVATVMAEYERGTLHSGGGGKVTNPKQAIAIALSEARKSKKNDLIPTPQYNQSMQTYREGRDRNTSVSQARQAASQKSGQSYNSQTKNSSNYDRYGVRKK